MAQLAENNLRLSSLKNVCIAALRHWDNPQHSFLMEVKVKLSEAYPLDTKKKKYRRKTINKWSKPRAKIASYLFPIPQHSFLMEVTVKLSKAYPLEYIYELIIWKLNPLIRFINAGIM